MIVTLKLQGVRQIDAAQWIIDKPTPEEIDPEGAEWFVHGVSFDWPTRTLAVPTAMLNDFIAECEYGAEQIADMAEQDGWDDSIANARAISRALLTIATKLKRTA